MYSINLLKSSHPLLWRNPEKNVYIRTESYRLFPLININKRLRVILCSHKTKTWTMRNLLCDCGHQRRVRWIAGGGGYVATEWRDVDARPRGVTWHCPRLNSPCLQHTQNPRVKQGLDIRTMMQITCHITLYSIHVALFFIFDFFRFWLNSKKELWTRIPQYRIAG